MADPKLTVTLTNPETKQPVELRLKKFTAENLESFSDIESDVHSEMRRLRKEAEEFDARDDMPTDEREVALKEMRRRAVRLRLCSEWKLLQSAIDPRSIKVDNHREGIMADPQEDGRWLDAADFGEVTRALRSFRNLLGLA